MRRTLTVSRWALAAAAGTACLFFNDNPWSSQQSGVVTQAQARVGHPATPGSVAGVARRQNRRAVRRGAAAIGVVGAATGAAAAGYYGAADAGGYGTVGAGGPAPADAAPAAPPAAAAADVSAAAPAGPPPMAGPGGPYGGYPTSATVVDPATGRWCTINASGWHWCWTP